MGAAVCHRNKETQGKLLADSSYKDRGKSHLAYGRLLPRSRHLLALLTIT